MLRVVLDTNVFVSSLLSKSGMPAKLLDAWREGQYLLVTSPLIIGEIKKVLEYTRIREKYGIAQSEINGLIEVLNQDAVVVPGQSKLKGKFTKDPEDEMFLACAQDAGADLIVSGDKHLLELGEYLGIPIITVRQFFERLGMNEIE